MEDPKAFIGRHISQIPSPALVVSLAKVKTNCGRMRKKCAVLGIALRPHVKTHKTIEGALLQTGGLKRGIVVSTLAEAWHFANAGFDDIVLGRPATEHLFERSSSLRHSISSLHFLINSHEGFSAAENEGNLEKPVSCLLKISGGYERAGIPWDQIETIRSLAQKLTKSSNTVLQGIYVHCGNSYTTNGATQVRDETVSRTLSVRDALLKIGIECLVVGIGSTPSCSLPTTDQMKELTEMHPGNYAFYDCQQESYGACVRADIAARVLTRVVSHLPQKNQLLVDLGFTGLTKQGLDLAVPGFGAIDGYPNLKLSTMTQELGKIETVDGSALPFADIPIDSILFVFPYHACATAGMYSHYYIHDTDDIIQEIWYPTRGW